MIVPGWLRANISHLLHNAAGHSGISHDAKIDTTFGICLGNFLGGLSPGGWKQATMFTTSSPTTQNTTFFAVSARFLENLYSSYHNRVMEFDAAARIFIPVQDYLYYVIICFGGFNLYVLSW